MTIDEIYKNEEISVRSYNSCKYNDINTIHDLREYFLKYKTFKKLRNCGEKSNLELIQLCCKFQDPVSLNFVTEDEDSLLYRIKNLSRLQRQVINSFIKVNTSNLQVRSKNAIERLFSGSPRLKDLSSVIFEDKHFKISNIRNIGKSSIPELDAYLRKIKQFILDISDNNDEVDLICINNKLFIQNIFSLEEIPTSILQSQSIIILCKFLIDQRVFFKERHNYIFIETINVFNRDSYKTLDNIASKFYYTRERARQIREKCYDQLFNKLSFLRNIEDDFYQNYKIDTNNDYLIITEQKTNEINDFCNTNFTKNFLTYIFYVYLSDDFNIIGNIKDTLIIKNSSSRNRHNWNNIYLVKKEFDQLIALDKLIEDVSSRLQEKIEETYRFNFKSYLSRFLKTNDSIISDVIITFCEKLLIEELDIYLDLDDNIIFQRTTLKGLPEYIIEVLDEIGEPTTVESIYSILEKAHPGLTKSSEALRGSCNRTNELIYFGRSSTYGLKKWEKENNNIKGGTIRSISKDYLDNFDIPKHISEITEYVLQYRPKSNEYSISQNLKLDESGIFKFYKSAYVGLSSKNYDPSFSPLNKSEMPIRRSWKESYELLENFIDENSRLPFSSNCPKDEETLYRWYNIQKRKCDNEELDTEKYNYITKICDLSPDSVRRTHSTDRYAELNNFINIKGRVPSANKNGEGKLYQFFYKQRKLFENDNLSNEDEIKFIEMAKKLQKNKI